MSHTSHKVTNIHSHRRAARKTCDLMGFGTGHTGYKAGAAPVLLAMFHPFQHGVSCGGDGLALLFLARRR